VRACAAVAHTSTEEEGNGRERERARERERERARARVCLGDGEKWRCDLEVSKNSMAVDEAVPEFHEGLFLECHIFELVH